MKEDAGFEKEALEEQFFGGVGGWVVMVVDIVVVGDVWVIWCQGVAGWVKVMRVAAIVVVVQGL